MVGLFAIDHADDAQTRWVPRFPVTLYPIEFLRQLPSRPDDRAGRN